MGTFWVGDTPPTAPYKAVIFISERSEDRIGYDEMDEHLMSVVRDQPGFLGYSSQGNGNGSIFISYWKDDESIASWRDREDHLRAKGSAKRWYRYYHSMVCEVNTSVIFAG